MCFASNLIGLDLDRTANIGDPHLPGPTACLRLIRALAGNENFLWVYWKAVRLRRRPSPGTKTAKKLCSKRLPKKLG
jgi:hypothetical protein